MKPADLAKELSDAQSANKPVVVCSGVRVLYEGAHVPGAVYHGPAVKPEGLEDLRKWDPSFVECSCLLRLLPFRSLSEHSPGV